MRNSIENIPIIDAHHHLWDLDTHNYPWLTDRITKRVCGEYSKIRKNYLLQDFQRDTAEINLIKSIHVQAECDDPIAETQWLQGIADGYNSGGVPHGMVAFTDFSISNAQEVLEKQKTFKNVVGIRQMLHEGQIDPDNPGPSLIQNPFWMKQLGLLEKYGMTFDLQVYFQQMPDAEVILRKYPNILFVLCHMGQPARRDTEGLEGWRSGMKKLAAFENLAVKISGIGMFDRTWTLESLRPFVEYTIEAFGSNRCMFGSNFPVDGMMSGYSRLWHAYSEITKSYSDDERAQLFAGNAERIYLNQE